ncbi:MAG TPA: TolC family protein [Bryobacteraceae bacterium]|nr:TolC family protein [Bryobacteraceae bacterium]
MTNTSRKWIAAGLCYLWPVSLVLAQQDAVEPVRPSAPVLWRPYLAPEVPPARLDNSARLHDLIRAGNLYLTVRDAIALALENNIDLAAARYNPLTAEWSVTRYQAGGALPGVPSGATQTSFVASGQGVLGTQQAAGVSTATSTAGRGAGNTSIVQIGPSTPTLDPAYQMQTTFSHQSLPQSNSVLSSTAVLIRNQRLDSGTLTEGFLSGGTGSVSYTDTHLNENAPTDVLNPSSAQTLTASFQQYLLQGFGVAVNSRNITVRKINLQTSELNFRTQVISTVVNVLNTYYSLVADYEDRTAKKSALEAAQKFYDDTKKQVDIGTLADIELTRAESQTATSQQNLVNSDTSLEQDELKLKNLISRNGVEDPQLASVRIVPLDRIVIPEKDDLPPVKDLAEKALATRTDLAAEKANITASEVSALGTKNGLLPTLVGFVSTTQSGLSGTARTVNLVTTAGKFVETPNPYFVGGIGDGLGQVFRRDFPTELGGEFFSAPIRNRQAQADFGIDQLQLRQQQLTTQKDLKQAQVDVLNSVIALRQARAHYDAAVKNRVLSQQLLDAEQKKYALGASIPYNVIQQQRDLVAAQSSEVAALLTYSNARVSLDQTLGTTLETNQISIADARGGKVAQPSALPAVLPDRQ